MTKMEMGHQKYQDIIDEEVFPKPCCSLNNPSHIYLTNATICVMLDR